MARTQNDDAREELVQLWHLAVPASLTVRLRRLARETGAAQAWHRRRALERYLTDEEARLGLGPVDENEA